MKVMKKNNLWKKVKPKQVVTGVISWENCLEIPDGIISIFSSAINLEIKSSTFKSLID